MRFFLTPAVKCPSTKANHDHPPHRRAINNCAALLRDELLSVQPERILALGKVPFMSLGSIFGIGKDETGDDVAVFHKKTWLVDLRGQKILLGGTYFPGNNRTRVFLPSRKTLEGS